MGINHIKNALPIVAAAYGRTFGLRVLIGGDVACTNGYDIILPDADIYNLSYQKVAWGYLAHEAAHIRYTDFQALVDPSQEAFRFTLLNILEDVRVERCIFQDLPGTRHNIHAVIEYLAERGRFSADSAQPLAVHFQMWILCHLRIHILQQTILNSQYEALSNTLSTVLERDVIDRIILLLHKVEGLVCTLDALRLTDEIIACLQSIDDSSGLPPLHSEPYSQSDHLIEHTDEVENENASARKDLDVDSQHNQIEGHSNTSSQSLECEGNEHSQLNMTSQTERIEQMLRVDMDDCLRDTFSDMADYLSLIASESRGDKTTTCLELPSTVPIAEVARPSEQYDVNSLQLSTAALRVKLKSVLMSHQLRKVKPALRGTKIAKRHLARSQIGHQKIFYRTNKVRGLNTYVHLLVDNSGSMNSKNHYQTANSAAYCLAHALEMFSSIECEVTYFPGVSSPVKRVLLHSQRATSQAPIFAQACGGSTPLAESLFYVAERVALRNKPRNLVIVITDGKPDDMNSTLAVVRLLERAGVELFGLGIGTQSVKDLFSCSDVISQSDAIPDALFNAIQTAFSRLNR